LKKYTKVMLHSFERLFRQYYAPLCLFARRFVSDRDDCEEIVQGFFTSLWEKREAISITTSVKSYLFGSVRNRCLNHIKHQKIKQEYANERLSHPDEELDYSKYYLEIDLQQKIEKSIEALPPRRREIFILNREQGLKYREIADQLGISVKTVETQMGQALKELREQLKEIHRLIITFLISRLKKMNFSNC
jgi:RNA polymerase sigma-70 factor, ECF subfamily